MLARFDGRYEPIAQLPGEAPLQKQSPRPVPERTKEAEEDLQRHRHDQAQRRRTSMPARVPRKLQGQT